MKKNGLLSVILSLSLLIGATSAPMARADDDAAARWSKMSEAEKAHVRENYAKWKALPESEKKEVRERASRFRALPPEKRVAIRERYKKFQNLPPERQALIRKRFEEFRKLSPEERRVRVERWKKRKDNDATNRTDTRQERQLDRMNRRRR